MKAIYVQLFFNANSFHIISCRAYENRIVEIVTRDAWIVLGPQIICTEDQHYRKAQKDESLVSPDVTALIYYRDNILMICHRGQYFPLYMTSFADVSYRNENIAHNNLKIVFILGHKGILESGCFCVIVTIFMDLQ